jgi:NCS1 family nucleobase:cation symporter-1
MDTAVGSQAVTGSERGSVLERHGIDWIPPEERHGRPFSLLTFWFASNAQMLAISVGVLAVAVGLDLPLAIVAIVVGNAVGGLYMALHSAQGPRLGLPQMMQSRAQFGMYGAALPNIIVVLMYIGYFTTSGVLGGEGFADLIHVTTAEGIMIFNFINLLIVWFGYDLFHRFNRHTAWLSTIIFCVVLGDLVTRLPAHLPAGTSDTPGTVLLVVGIIVSWQVTWAPYVSDYSRYLPEKTSSVKSFAYTWVGSVVGANLVMTVGAIGALIALHSVNTNLPGYLSGLLAAKWLFLIIFLFGMIAGSYPNLYGPYLTAFAVVSPSGKLASARTGLASRIPTTTVIAIIGTLIAIKASSNFETDLSNFLVFTLYLLVPWTAINLTDYYVIRRGNYNIPELFKTKGIYGQFNWFALAVYVAAVGVQFPFMSDSAIFVGPVPNSIGGATIAWIVGFIFAALAYYGGIRLMPSSSRNPVAPSA